MLKKANRADKKTIERIFKEGRFINSTILTFKFLKNSNRKRRISIVVPKSVAKLAVKRNLLRRLGYKSLEKQIKEPPLGVVGALIFKKYEENIAKIEDEIKNIFNKLN